MIIQPPSYQQVSKKIWINWLNSLLGIQLAHQLRNDHQIEINPNIILGRIDITDSTPHPQYTKVENKIHSFSSDIIIYELNYKTLREVQELVQIFKYGDFQKNNKIIIISGFETWNNTIKYKDIKKGNVEEQQIQQDLLKKISPITQKCYNQKKCNVQHLDLRYVQNQVIQLIKQKNKIQTYLIHSGYIYGNGQYTLFQIFKSAYLQDPKQLPYFDTGKNIIPMIHVNDLVSIIKIIINHKIKPGVYFAVDQNCPCQKSFITTLSNYLGSGQTISLISEQKQEIINSLNNPFYYLLNLNLYAKSTPLMSGNDQIIFKRHSRGIVEDIDIVVKQFIKYRELKANKIQISGAPVSGKSSLAAKLGEHYNLPIIQIQQLIEMAKNTEGQFGEWARKVYKQTEDKCIEEQHKIFEDNRKKKKPKKNQPVQEFNPANVKVRLSDQIICKFFQWRLEQPECQNKGFILDNYPKNIQQSNLLYTQKYQVQVQKIIEQQDGNKVVKQIQDKIRLKGKFIPENVFVLEIKEDVIRERAKNDSKYKEDYLNKKIINYKKNQEQQAYYFYDSQIIKKMDGNISTEELFLQSISFIQRVYCYYTEWTNRFSIINRKKFRLQGRYSGIKRQQ